MPRYLLGFSVALVALWACFHFRTRGGPADLSGDSSPLVETGYADSLGPAKLALDPEKPSLAPAPIEAPPARSRLHSQADLLVLLQSEGPALPLWGLDLVLTLRSGEALTATKLDGKYLWRDLPQGQYTVLCKTPGWSLEPQPLLHEGLGVHTILAIPSRQVTGRLSLGEGSPLPPTVVISGEYSVGDASGPPGIFRKVDQVPVDPTGRFWLVPPGNAWSALFGIGFDGERRLLLDEVMLPSAGIIDLGDVAFVNCRSVSLSVVDAASGMGVSNAQVLSYLASSPAESSASDEVSSPKTPEPLGDTRTLVPQRDDGTYPIPIRKGEVLVIEAVAQNYATKRLTVDCNSPLVMKAALLPCLVMEVSIFLGGMDVEIDRVQVTALGSGAQVPVEEFGREGQSLHFAANCLEPGAYSVKVYGIEAANPARASAQLASKEVLIAAEQQTTQLSFDFGGEPEGCSLGGRLVLPRGAEPLSSRVFLIRPGSDKLIRAVSAEPDGSFIIRGIEPGSYDLYGGGLSEDMSRLWVAHSQVEIPPGARLNADLVVLHQTLRGITHGPNGEILEAHPVDGELVGDSPTSAAMQQLLHLRASPTGLFEVTGLRDGRYRFATMGDEWASEFVVEDGRIYQLVNDRLVEQR